MHDVSMESGKEETNGLGKSSSCVVAGDRSYAVYGFTKLITTNIMEMKRKWWSKA